MQLFKITDPFIFTIFGASGDLAKLKLFPSLYALQEQKRFPEEFYIVGYARSSKEQQQFRDEFAESVRKARPDLDETVLSDLLKHVHYFSGLYNNIEDYRRYRGFLDELSGNKTMSHIAYFSVPPTVFRDIIQNLAESRKSRDEDIRLVLEKPFGQDLRSAQELYHFTMQHFSEENFYLLDHYLGKGPVRSIYFLRRLNPIFHLLLNGHSIANIQITAFEHLGVGERVGYFDQVGTIRDMIQSHLLQILSLLTMAIPASNQSSSIHREKYHILSSLTFPECDHNLVLGQYESYRTEKNVPPDSRTETFAAAKLFIDLETWHNVPIYIRTGKKLAEKKTSIVVEFKKFEYQKDDEPNRLVIKLAPEETMQMSLLNRLGATIHPSSLTVSESLACVGDDCLPDHALLLLDIIRADKTYFLTFQQIISAWELVDRILHKKTAHQDLLYSYPDESRGPIEQDSIPNNDGFRWYEA